MRDELPGPSDARADSEAPSLVPSMSRRALLKVALVVPASGLFGCRGRTAPQASAPTPASAAAFLSGAERRFLDAATERLIPDEEDGLGARGAAVVEFIDRQLAGSYGRAERWYMHGPWQNGVPQQGYQLKLTPAELYRTAIRDIDRWCAKQHSMHFSALSGADQDDVLHGLESGDIELADVPAKAFFTMLWKNTVEGFLSDPIYGGNRDFAGWKLVGFPGPRYNYVAEIEQYGKAYTEPTVGLMGRDPSRFPRE